ncbi:Thioredoxin [Giardia muris]|uniref:Thioredoxin n=1 Tax=Giardia muris TaxID=5742 RepID=A0A4Z1TDT9_GIAMU|nr:Thioredoxin [Giardia muris]|eukprot:TNJ30719.1 Thioredoxin [Giardia muris]
MLKPIEAPEYPPNDWYEPSEEAIAKINAAGPLEMIIFHGPWCKDCQYMIPVFNRIQQFIKNDAITMTVAEVAKETRKDPNGLCEKYGVSKVPSWVILKNGNEVGRIIENFKESFDEDVAAML